MTRGHDINDQREDLEHIHTLYTCFPYHNLTMSQLHNFFISVIITMQTIYTNTCTCANSAPKHIYRHMHTCVHAHTQTPPHAHTHTFSQRFFTAAYSFEAILLLGSRSRTAFRSKRQPLYCKSACGGQRSDLRPARRHKPMKMSHAHIRTCTHTTRTHVHTRHTRTCTHISHTCIYLG